MVNHWAFAVKVAFVVVTVTGTIAVIAYAVKEHRHVPPKIPAEKRGQKQRETAIENRLSLSAKLFDIAAALIGFIWALAILGTSGVKLHTWMDVLLFVVTNVLLLLSLLFHLLYKRRVSSLQWDLSPQQPDILGAYVDYLFQTQWFMFFWSLVVGLLTVFAVVVLGESPIVGNQ